MYYSSVTFVVCYLPLNSHLELVCLKPGGSSYNLPYAYTMKVSRQKSFTFFILFRMSAKLFHYESLRWRCSSMDLREHMSDSLKIFLQRSTCTTWRETFCLIVYSICICIRSYIATVNCCEIATVHILVCSYIL